MGRGLGGHEGEGVWQRAVAVTEGVWQQAVIVTEGVWQHVHAVTDTVIDVDPYVRYLGKY